MPKKAKQTTADIHRAVAQKVIAAMETHGADWAKSWAVPQGDGPLSMSTGKHYQGINWLILGMARAAPVIRPAIGRHTSNGNRWALKSARASAARW